MSHSQDKHDHEGIGACEPQAVSLSFLTPAMSPDELGWLAHYRILKVLGQGGMGIVLLAEDVQLLRRVALKVIRPEIGQSFSNRQRFLREARAMAQVHSDHVVTIYQVGQVDDVCYLAMEFLEGESLERWLDGRPTPPLNETLRICREIALALAAAHSLGLVHRDVKPGNIWLEGPTHRVKLLDFGLVRPQTEEAQITNPGMVVGTPMYMAPEQARGEVVDGRADLFSLGCVLYQMLAGRPPFNGLTPLAVLSAVLTETPPPLNRYNHAVPAPLNDLLTRLLAKQPSARPNTAEAVVAELHTIELALSVFVNKPTIMAVLGPPPTQTVSPLGPFTSEYRPPSVSPSVGTPLPSHEPRVAETPPAQRRIRDAERRQVTVLVSGTDLFESEEYLALDAEDQSRVLRTFGQLREQAVQRFEGTVVQNDERWLLACFGYPVAYEDAASRAARTGLALLADLKVLGEQLQREHKLALNYWVGIHTGPAVVEARDDAISLVGEARTVAVRLEDVASLGHVVCSRATHQLIRHQFDCASLGPSKLKGLPQPVELFRVEAVAARRNPMDSIGPSLLTPLTGRDNEVSLLKERWEQVTEGMGQIVLLIGDPGLGKSRLVYTLKSHVQQQTGEASLALASHPSSASSQATSNSPIIEWRCSPQFRNTSLYPAIDFFERSLGFGRDEVPVSRFDRLVRYLGEHDLAKPDIVPLFASLLSLPLDHRFPALGLSPVREREEIFRALREWLRAYSSERPVLFILEDLHWLDASTLEFLEQFLSEGLYDRILILLTFRPEFKTPWPAVANQTSLSLNRLSRRQVGELMRSKTSRPVPDALVQQVFDRTGGVPLFVEEYTKTVQELGVLDQAAGTGASVLLTREIPATLQDLVMARLDRMGSEREVAQLAAVLGREFSYELLAAAVLARPAVVSDEATLNGELAKLTQAEILYPKGRPPKCTYIFKHALLEDALYNALVKAKRQQFHQRIGEVLELQFPQVVEAHPELLGRHFTEAGQNEKAVCYWLKAGQRSRERSADHEAISHLTKCLSVLETLEGKPEHDCWELKAITTLAPAYIAARGYAAPEVGPLLLRALELSKRIGDSQQLFGIMLGLWEWRLVRGDLRQCVDLASDGVAYAERLNDPGMLMEALFMPGVTGYYRAQFVEARVSFEKALANYEDSERTKFWTAYTGHNASVTHRCYLALILWHLGYPDQALRLARETCELARKIGHAFSLGHAVDFLAVLCHNCRMGAEVQTAAEEEIALGTEQGFQLWHALGMIHKGVGLFLQGRRDDALPLLQKGFSAFRATGAGVRVPRYFGTMADVYTRLGKFEDAHLALNEGLAMVEQNDERGNVAELQRIKGELVLAEFPEKLADAEACFRQAIETARHQQTKGLELRATMSLARLWQRQNRRDEAHAALAAVYGTYTEGFTTPDLVDAAALLESLK